MDTVDAQARRSQPAATTGEGSTLNDPHTRLNESRPAIAVLEFGKRGERGRQGRKR